MRTSRIANTEETTSCAPPGSLTPRRPSCAPPRIANTAVDAPAVDAPPSTRRLNIMRFGYAFMGVGLVIVKWPLLLHAPSLRVMEGVVLCLLTAMSLLAFLGRNIPSGCADPAVRGRLEADLDRHGRHPPPDGR